MFVVERTYSVFFLLKLGTKLREARQSAGSFVGEVAKDAKVNVADVAERVGSLFKSRWAILQQPATRHAVQEHLITAAATTGTLVRKGLTETKEVVSVGKIKVEEVYLVVAKNRLSFIFLKFSNS